MKSFKVKYYFSVILLFIQCNSISQNETISIKENTFTNEIMRVSLLSTTKEHPLLPSVVSGKSYHIYPKYYLSDTTFKTLYIKHNRGKFDIDILLSKEGKKRLEQLTTGLEGESLVSVFNDTIQNIQKIAKADTSGVFKLKGFTEKQKNAIVFYYQNIPLRDLQQEFFESINNKDYKSATSAIEKGAFPAIKDFDDKLLLRKAHFDNDKELIAFYNNLGVKFKSKDLEEAIYTNDLDFIKKHIKELRSQKDFQKKINQLFISAISDSSIEIIDFIVDSGADINTKVRGANSIGYALAYNTIDVVKHLVNKGLDIKENNFHLDAAIIYSEYEVFEYLITIGYDVNFKDNEEGYTPLHTLASTSFLIPALELDGENRDIVSMAKLLVINGADPNIKNDEGKTPLDVAIDKLEETRYTEDKNSLLMYLKEITKK